MNEQHQQDVLDRFAARMAGIEPDVKDPPPWRAIRRVRGRTMIAGDASKSRRPLIPMLAAVALLVALVAGAPALLGSRPVPPAPTIAQSPTVHVLSAVELTDAIRSGTLAVGQVVLAQVDLIDQSPRCTPPPHLCPVFRIGDISPAVTVLAPAGTRNPSGGVLALRYHPLLAFDLLGVVTPGPDRLSWSVADSLHGTWSLALVEAWLGALNWTIPCPAPPSPDPDSARYGCGHAEWLADAPSEPDPYQLRPPGALPVENGSYASFAPDASAEDASPFPVPRHGAYLVQLVPHSCIATENAPITQCSFVAVVGRVDPVGGPRLATSPSPSTYPDGIPAAIDGMPVLRPSAAAARADSAIDGSPFLVGGWTEGAMAPSCASALLTAPPAVLAPWCRGGPTLGERPGDPGLWSRLFNLRGVALPMSGALVLRVHAHDPLATQCSADVRPTCEAALVIEAVVWRQAPEPSPSISASPEPTPPSPISPTAAPAGGQSRELNPGEFMPFASPVAH